MQGNYRKQNRNWVKMGKWTTHFKFFKLKNTQTKLNWPWHEWWKCKHIRISPKKKLGVVVVI